MSIGQLVLVATPLGNLGDLSPRAVDALNEADVIACEDTRHSRKLLHHAGITGRRLIAVHAHNEQEQCARLVADMLGGTRIALITDAGTPGISDPGERLVAACVSAGVPVGIVPGPSAVIAALVLSGLPTGRFCFEGFLPRKGKDRAERLRALAGDRRTTVLYEAPHRLATTVTDLAESFGDDRPVAIARELTKKFEDVWRGTLGEAAARAAEVEARGEFVIVIGGAAPEPPPTQDAVDEALQARFAAGETTKDAAAAVAAELNVPKRQVYSAALRLKSASPPPPPASPPS